MDQMLLWAFVYRELARGQLRTRCEDEFYRNGGDADAWWLLRSTRMNRARGPVGAAPAK